MEMFTLGKTHVPNLESKKILEIRHKILDHETGVNHTLIWTDMPDGSFELEVQIPAAAADSTEYLVSMMMAAERVRQMEKQAKMLAVIDQMTGGMLSRALVAEMQADGVEVPQELLDLINGDMITATIVEDEHTVH